MAAWRELFGKTSDDVETDERSTVRLEARSEVRVRREAKSEWVDDIGMEAQGKL